MSIKTNNNAIIKDSATLTTSGVTSGLLQPEQSKKFLREAMDSTALGGLVRHEMRVTTSGEIDKIGISRRIMRAKTENHDDGYRAGVRFDDIKYQNTAVRLPWEITEETLRQNIEGQHLEALITSLMTQAVGLDMEDLWLNADESVDASNPDYEFLKLNTGWIKQIKDGGHVVDRSGVDSGELSLNVWNDALYSMPNKYNNGSLRWLMSPHRKQSWENFLLDKAITAGGIISDRRIENPFAIQSVSVPSMPDDCVILTNPKNLIVTNSYSMKIRKTTEGKEAIMMDKRFYTIHLDFDCIIEELDATVIMQGLAPVIPTA